MAQPLSDRRGIEAKWGREEPRLFFAHFWGNDDAVKLARGLRSALDKMRVGQAAP